jgi:hypothetical protein
MHSLRDATVILGVSRFTLDDAIAAHSTMQPATIARLEAAVSQWEERGRSGI